MVLNPSVVLEDFVKELNELVVKCAFVSLVKVCYKGKRIKIFNTQKDVNH
jgi:hypothetical protein